VRAALRGLVPLGAFVALLGLLAAGLRLDPRELPSPLVGKPAPEFALPRLDDPSRTLARADLLGTVWVLNIWASWCTGCVQEHASLLAFARSRQVPVYGLNYKDSGPAARAWLARLGNPYEASAFDPQGRTGMDYGVYGVPETFVIDRQGVVRYRQAGPLSEEILRTRIVPLLAQLGG
jgi:cytochrome c biogenesis protein CcmG/thiol:disulfide interchange protein DsbE